MLFRSTLQALLALEDNANSLHTNAFDEAVTTPTQDSVRRAVAIQLIINREFGLSKNENPLLVSPPPNVPFGARTGAVGVLRGRSIAMSATLRSEPLSRSIMRRSRP